VLFPGTAQCLLIGQNGILSTLIIGVGLSELERKPLLAGAILIAIPVCGSVRISLTT
jgi:hypothetical protein